MPYASPYELRSMGGGGSGLGIGAGISSGLLEGLKAASDWKQQRMAEQQQQYDNDPNNPENQLKAAQAKAEAASASPTETQEMDLGVFDPRLKGMMGTADDAIKILGQKQPLPGQTPQKVDLGKFDPSLSGVMVDADKVVPLLEKRMPGGSGTPEAQQARNEKLVEDLTTELSTMKGAYDTANKNGLFNPGPSNFVGDIGRNFTGIPGLGSVIANHLPNGAQDYTTRMKDAMYRVATIINGGRPNQQMQEELQKQIPTIGMDPDKAKEQFNALISSAEARAQGLINQKMMAGDTVGAQQLSDQLNNTFGQFRIGEEGQGVSTNIQGSGLNPAPGSGPGTSNGPTPQGGFKSSAPGAPPAAASGAVADAAVGSGAGSGATLPGTINQPVPGAQPSVGDAERLAHFQDLLAAHRSSSGASGASAQ